MSDRFGDARLEELQLLAEIERRGRLEVREEVGPRRDMLAHLAHAGFVNDLKIHWYHNSNQTYLGLPGESDLERQLHQARMDTLSRVLGGETVQLEVTHRGRIRISELRQVLKSERVREQYGILWDGRHLETDLKIALLDASQSTPLSVAYLDMNGLKIINDGFGHSAGDAAVKAYFLALSTALRDQGEAYRVGGDEVFAILPGMDRNRAVEVLRKASLLLTQEQLRADDKELPRLSVAIGLVTTTDRLAQAEALRRSADKAMYRAKDKTKSAEGQARASAIAFEGDEAVVEVRLNDVSARRRESSRL